MMIAAAVSLNTQPASAAQVSASGYYNFTSYVGFSSQPFFCASGGYVGVNAVNVVAPSGFGTVQVIDHFVWKQWINSTWVPKGDSPEPGGVDLAPGQPHQFKLGWWHPGSAYYNWMYVEIQFVKANAPYTILGTVTLQANSPSDYSANGFAPYYCRN
jgi:hypothetical protein